MSTHWLILDETNFSGNSHVVCVRFAGYDEAIQEEDLVYLAVNSGWFPVTLTLPELFLNITNGKLRSTPAILNVSFFTKIQCLR